MNLFNVSLKNVKNSISNYGMYFISIIFSVFIYFTFKSIQYNEGLSTLRKSMKSGLNAASIVIVVFSFVFMYYSNSFFINRRKQEIGTYSLLGMRKTQIGKIFLYENFIIGIVAIILGIVLGFLFSKLMTMILVKFMGEYVVIKMRLSVRAIIQTVETFAIIFIIIGIRNYFFIKRTKLINLFKKEKEVVTTNKTIVVIKGIFGIGLIILSYIIATSDMLIREITMAPMILIIIIPGTFLFFSSVVSIILNIVKKNKMFYYRGRNLIAFSELSYKISSNSKILSTIAILVATSVTALGFCISLYYDIDKNIEENYKFSYNINGQNQTVNSEINNILNKNRKNHIVEFDKIVELIEKKAKYDLVSKKDKISKERGGNIHLIKESDFECIMNHQNRVYNELKNKNDVYYISNEGMTYFYESLDNQQINLIYENQSYVIKKHYTDLLLNTQSTFDLVVIKDNVFNQYKIKDEIYKLRVIDISNEQQGLNIARDIQRIVKESIQFYYPFNFTSSITMRKELLELYGLMLFIGLFLGTIFLLCTGSIILFKQLSSIYDDKERYLMLKKLGAKNKDIQKMLSKQLKIIFILPLMVGTIHNLFAMTIVQKIIPRSITSPILITLGIYYIGYFIYYFITLKYAKNMIIE
ncbi:ABC transporter permease [Oceanirhabdus seepicola]|uniref:FtsX-like permease family protein n=1 Tax=Oceanirhabdus seepicola TaxID=2828781 RepID=A0A9J6P0G6_9CLOT|nr:FtsX-like permease family protein [Oceanirhabdus seepicola]MCM1990186.1 FtsX-like permease family protein [Oceanirhabdus seepicola]